MRNKDFIKVRNRKYHTKDKDLEVNKENITMKELERKKTKKCGK